MMDAKTLERELIQPNFLAEVYERANRGFKALRSGRALGLDMFDLDVIGAISSPNASLKAYAHESTDFCDPDAVSWREYLMLTVVRYDKDHTPTERLRMAVEKRSDTDIGTEVLDRAEVDVLSPADTALELTEEDVEPLERVFEMCNSPQARNTMSFLEAIIDEPVGANGCGMIQDGTLYVMSANMPTIDIIREDGTILPLRRSLFEPSDKLDGEREEIIRPRIEDLRAPRRP